MADLTMHGAGDDERGGSRDQYYITGMSGRFPESDNVAEFAENLADGVDMITEDDRRWKAGMYGLPRRLGKLKNPGAFDAEFFKINPKQVNNMDPQLRILLECAYEAISDSGYHPSAMRGSRTGVFVGASFSDAHMSYTRDSDTTEGYAMTGCTLSMMANRISFFFNLTGPSQVVDTACSSTFVALSNAFMALRTGSCDAALVGGSHLIFRPHSSLQFNRLNMLAEDGKCKTFDSSGSGYVRSETVGMFFIQKKQATRRAYGELLSALTNNDGWKADGITVPNGMKQAFLIRQVLRDSGTEPHEVSYLECHGTGTKVGDPQEMNGALSVYRPEGSLCDALLIGSVKSNCGHAEPASGVASLTKALLILQSGEIPANLHFNNANPNIEGIANKRMRVVTTKTRFPHGRIALNSSGFGGSNVHVVIGPAAFSDQDSIFLSGSPISRCLVSISARTEQAVEKYIEYIDKNFSDKLYHLALCAFKANDQDVFTFPHRGYLVRKGKSGTIRKKNMLEEKTTERRQVWFICSGMGTQWFRMATKLLDIRPFCQSLVRSQEILRRSTDVDLFQILLYSDRSVLEERTKEIFVAIAAIQIALVDCLLLIGLEPDGIIGHSVGEIVCAYIDGCFTAEETLMVAYWRGRCIGEGNLPDGAMAAIGLTWEQCKERCPANVIPACHNAENTVTISGAKADVHNFVHKLQSENVFARDVNSANVAFHSPCLKTIAPELLKRLTALLRSGKSDRKRSSKWICSSIPMSDWATSPIFEHSSAEYHVNNFCSPVYFHDAVKMIPAGSVVVEIAPHCLLKSVVKRSVDKSCDVIGLLNRNENDMDFFLDAIGQLQLAGISAEIHYERLFFSDITKTIPVSSRNVAPLSPSIGWDHSNEEWTIPFADGKYDLSGSGSGSHEISVDIGLSDWKFVEGHTIDGRILFPATGYVWLVWTAVSKMLSLERKCSPELPSIEFRDIEFRRATTFVPAESKTKPEVKIFSIAVLDPEQGRFQIKESGDIVVEGTFKVIDTSQKNKKTADIVGENLYIPNGVSNGNYLNKQSFYRLLRRQGYEYFDHFQNVESFNMQSRVGELLDRKKEDTAEWWVSSLDMMLQLCLIGIGIDGYGLRLPSKIDHLVLRPELASSAVTVLLSPRCMLASTKDGAVELRGMKTQKVNRKAENRLLISDAAVLHKQDLCLVKMCDGTKSEATCHQLVSPNLCSNADGTNGMSPTRSKLSSEMHRIINCMLIDAIKKTRGNPANKTISIVEIDHKCPSEMNISRRFDEHGSTINVNYTRCLLHHASPTELQEAENIKTISKAELDTLAESSDADNVDILILLGVDDANISLKPAHKLKAVSRFTVTVTAVIDNSVNSEVDECNNVILDRMVEDTRISVSRPLNGTSRKARFVQVDDDREFCWLDELKSKPMKEEITIWLYGTTETSGVFGLGQCLRQELKGIPIRTLHAGESSWNDKALIDRIVKADMPDNVIIDGHHYCYTYQLDSNKLIMESRLDVVNSNTLNTKSSVERIQQEYCLNCVQRGDLSSLRWFPIPHSCHAPLSSEVGSGTAVKSWSMEPIEVMYAALNFRDVMLATGKLNPESIPGSKDLGDKLIGLEYAGVGKKSKKRWMGIISGGGMATVIDEPNRDYVFKIPDGWGLDEAATVPVVYCTAVYALIIRARVCPGETVLIHAGSGGVGLAAIRLCLALKCRVFTTVSTAAKKQFLIDLFADEVKADPSLFSINHIFNSRDISFEMDILHATSGKGVNIVLNSLAGELLQGSVRLLSEHGRFLEIGKFDLEKNSQLGMSVFLKNVTFHGILLDSLFPSSSSGSPEGLLARSDWEKVKACMNQYIESGVVRPLPRRVFARADVEKAFRYMAQGKHTGKIVITICDDVVRQFPEQMIVRKLWFRRDRSYIVTGGLGGIGLELATWLADRNAGRIYLISSRGVKTGYQQAKLNMLRKRYGDVVRVCTCDMQSEQSCIDLIQKTSEDGFMLDGLFHLAAVLSDRTFDNLSVEDCQKVHNAKFRTIKYLDKALRKHFKTSVKNNNFDISHFVGFSSVVSAFGNVGQANYGFSNSSLDRLCVRRNVDGLRALSIQWGAIADVGMFAKLMESRAGNRKLITDAASVGMVNHPLPVHALLRTMEASILSYLSTRSDTIMPVTTIFATEERSSEQKSNVGSGNIADIASTILGINNIITVNPKSLLGELGLDSLGSVELSQVLEQRFEITINSKDLQNLSVAALLELHNKQLAGTSAAGRSEAGYQDAEADAAEQHVEQRSQTLSPDMIRSMFTVPDECLVKMNAIEYDPDGVVYILFPPMEGFLDKMFVLAKKLPHASYGLRCTMSTDMSSVDSITRFFIQELERNFRGQLSNRFVLIGYSYGSLISYHMALLIPDRIHHLVMVDGSPNYVRLFAEKNMKKAVDANQLEVRVYYFFLSYARILNRNMVISRLSKTTSKPDLLQTCLADICKQELKMDCPTVGQAACLFLRRLQAAVAYSSAKRLPESVKVALIKATVKGGDDDIWSKIAEDYGLSEICSDLTIHAIEADHQTIITDPRVYELIKSISDNW